MRRHFEATARAWASKYGASVWVDDRGAVTVENPPSGFGFTHGTAEEFFRRIGGNLPNKGVGEKGASRRQDEASVQPLAFPTAAQYRAATSDWGANCGIISFCAFFGISFDEAKSLFMPRFTKDGCVRPDHMKEVLTRKGVRWKGGERGEWPLRGLVVVRWMGRGGADQSWFNLANGASHWICVEGNKIFDAYETQTWGWMPRARWERDVLSRLVGESDPAGLWWVTDGIRVY